jgi:transposase
MFIRQTRTNNKASGEGYFTYRLVRSERIGGKVRQITLLNLGRHFPFKQADWPLLCSRLEQLLQPQTALISIVCPDAVEHAVQRYYKQLVDKASTLVSTEVTESGESPAPAAPLAAPAPDFQEVDVDSLQTRQPRTIGVEHVALHALAQIGFVDTLTELGINGVNRVCILGNLIGRIAAPGSERATFDWLQNHSGLGELLDVDFESLSHMRLYRASDLLMQHRAAIETTMFSSIQSLFNLDQTVTLFDLTNTYFEAEAADNPKAQYGRSKEKRTDCPLVTLGLVLDGSGFVRRSKTFAGNVAEAGTMESMLIDLGALSGALVIMDAGIATQANLDWLVAQGYRYLVVRRGGERQFDPDESVTIETASGEPLSLQKTFSEDGEEVLLYCHSAGREAKETAMVKRFCQDFEAGLNKIDTGLAKPRSEKRPDKLMQRIGRLKEKSRGASQHYQITLETDETGKVATALHWKKQLIDGTMATHPGVYCLRSNELTWSPEKLWRTYTMLTDLESVFRSLKSELGLRPVFHSNENRVDGHLFITVLAYQCVQVIRTQLKKTGIMDSWSSLRKSLSLQQRVTTTLTLKDKRTLHVRKSTAAEPAAIAIYRALNISSAPGGTRKMIV